MGSRVAVLLRRLAGLVRRSERDRELDEELRFHLEMGEAAARAQGATEEEARRAARLRLGSPLRLREESLDVLGFPRLEAFARDASLAARRLRRSPGFTLAAILTLALGIGANAALFALVDAVLLRPLPYPEPDRLVSLWEVTPDSPRLPVAPANLADYRVPAFESLAAWQDFEMDLSGEGRPETVAGHAVTADFFTVLGVGPALGRPFLPEEDREGGERVVILSDSLWRGRFGADPAILGRTIRVDREPRRVVGVMPPGFVTPGGLGADQPVSLLVPAAFPAELLANRGDHEARVVARLRREARLEEARAQLRTVSGRLASHFPDTNGQVRAHSGRLDDDVVREVRGSLLLLLGAVAAVLAIACLNVANLQIVRALGRRRELAVCVALGAARGHLAAGLLAESLLLALLGGAAGVGLAYWLLAGLKALAPAGTPRLAQAGLDARVLAFALLVTLATGLFFGLLPALQASRARPAEALQTGARQHSSRSVLRWRRALLVVEVALALVLLVGASLVLRSVARLNAMDLGFDTARVVAARINLPPAQYPDPDRRLAFFEEVHRRLSAKPGVEAVAFASNLPLRGGWGTGLQIEGRPLRGPGDLDTADAQAVSPGYFQTLGIPLLRGRAFEETDREGAPYVALVNQEFERVFFGGQSALGKRFRRWIDEPWVTVVGVVASLRRDGRASERTPQLYLAAAQTRIYPLNLADLAVRGNGGAAVLSALVRAEVAAVDPEQPISRAMTLDDTLARSFAPRRFGLALLAGFALTALALTLVGIYGVAAYSVSQRVPELGVRFALGADRGRILRLVLGEVLGQVLAGIVIGLGLSLLATRALKGLLFHVAPIDPGTYGVVALLVALAGLAAALGPGLRAARIDPVAALRWE